MNFRLRDFAYPFAILRARRFLAAAEGWPADRRVAYQIHRLRATLGHAAATSPWWRHRIAAAGLDPRLVSPATLAALPILDKDEVREHGAELRSAAARRFGPRVVHTSGSTGTPLELWLDKPTNVIEFATLWRQFNWAGYRFGQRFADLRGHLVEASAGVARDRRLNSLNLSAFALSRDRAPVYARALTGFAPIMVRGYPSSISLFAAWALEDRLALPSPVAVVTSSETLLEPQREVIERAFRAPVYDYYGQMERVAFAGQCPAGSHHVAEEYGLVEIVDDRGEAVKPGAPGRIIATGFHHRAMPLIRYDTRDVAQWSGLPCPCGRSARVIERVHGRLEDFVVTPDGRHVGRLDAAMKRARGIRLARIVQERIGEIVVEMVTTTDYDRQQEQVLLSDLRDRVGQVIAIRFARVSSLPLEPSGKLKFVVSRLGRGPIAGRA